MALTRDDLIALRAIQRRLASLECALDERLVIVRKVINPDGTVVGTIRRIVSLPKKEKGTRRY